MPLELIIPIYVLGAIVTAGITGGVRDEMDGIADLAKIGFWPVALVLLLAWVFVRFLYNVGQWVRRQTTKSLDALVVAAYALPDNVTIDRCIQADRTVRWAIRKSGSCLNTDGDWEVEPMPSNRTADFFARCRYATPEAAYAHWQRWHT